MITLLAPTTPFYADLAAKLGATHVDNWQAAENADIILYTNKPPQPLKAMLNICLASQRTDTASDVHHVQLPINLQQLQTFIARRQAAWVRLNGYTVDAIESTIYQHDTGEKTPITERELALVQYLARHPNGTTKDAILSTVWQYDSDIDSHTLESHLHRLRQKLPILESQDGRYLLATPTVESPQV